MSNLDSLGHIVKIRLKKVLLIRYKKINEILYKGISISLSFAKILGLMLQ